VLPKPRFSARTLPEANAEENSSKIYMVRDANLRGSNRFLQAKKQEREKQQLSFFREGKAEKGSRWLLPSPTMPQTVLPFTGCGAAAIHN